MNHSAISNRIKNLSLEEKIGQMTQVNLNVILEKGGENLDGRLNPEALKEAAHRNVGSILNAINRPYPARLWRDMIEEIQEAFQKHSSSKIPVLYGIDSIHGATYVQDSTLFPQNIALAATRNPDLARRTAEVCARQTRAAGIRWNFDPVFDVGRNPLWPRFPETFGEAPFLAACLGIAKMKGYTNGDLKRGSAVANCVKHFVGYGDPKSGKDRTPASYSPVELREIHLEPFRKAIKENPSSVMLNSSEINGEPVHASYNLLTKVLRHEWGYRGPVISDWEDILRLHTRHRIAETPKEAVKLAVNAGVDISMVPHDYSFHDSLKELVEEGEVEEKRIDEAVERIFRLKEEVGLFDHPETDQKIEMNKGTERALALESARAAITLLKNDNDTLPLRKEAKVLIAGPAANSVSALHGGWSYTWQGDNRRWYPKEAQSIQEALLKMKGEERIHVLPEHKFPEEEYYYFNIKKEELTDRRQDFAMSEDLKNELTTKAEEADCIVLCLGENAYAESPGVIDDLTLPEDQLELAETALATGKPCILVLVEGRPRIIRRIADRMDAIMMAYQPGSGGAQAVAETLFGASNPSGILPYTYPASPNDRVLHDHKFSEELQELRPGYFTNNGYHPEFPFGHGLSYTTFSVRDLEINKKLINENEVLKGKFIVANEGDRTGVYRGDLFIRDLYASVTPPVKRLKKTFCKKLDSGESAVIEFDIGREELEMVNHEGNCVVEPGSFEITVGSSTKRFAYAPS
jgi:beta-glucosidase